MLEQFTSAYISCALWTTTDDNGEPLDMLSEDDIAPCTLIKLRKDAADFYKAQEPLIKDRPEQAGHDFWLTRNGHGAGFWDGDWPEHGDALTAASKVYGSHDLFYSEKEERIY